MPDFFIDRTEVTNGDFHKFVRELVVQESLAWLDRYLGAVR